MIVIGDTSGLVSAFNADDPGQAAARSGLQQASVTVISPLVIAEIEHIMTEHRCNSAHAAIDLLAQERTPDIGAGVAAPVLRRLNRSGEVLRASSGSRRLVNVVLAAAHRLTAF